MHAVVCGVGSSVTESVVDKVGKASAEHGHSDAPLTRYRDTHN